LPRHPFTNDMDQQNAQMEQTLVMATATRGIDYATAMSAVGDDPELLAELASLFLESAPEYLAQIRAAVAGGNGRALESAAHSLKGSVGNLGAQSAFEAAFLLERCGRNGDFSEAARALPQLEAAMQLVNADLTALVAGN